jgi:hypothetical protein
MATASDNKSLTTQSDIASAVAALASRQGGDATNRANSRGRSAPPC